MYNGKRILGVIPARGGSKRTPRKNIREFRGRPLISWAIQSAQESLLLDLVVVSTEDAAIKAYVNLTSPEIEVIDRPYELASDEAMNEDVMRHALDMHEFDEVVLLQPTSPLRTGYDIDQCIQVPSRPALSVDEHGKKNGAVYVATADWLREGNYFSLPHVAFVMPLERSLDIDYPEQFV